MIGVYDSGIGGLSVWKELYAVMPEQDYVYVADSAHCPYGEKSREYIVERADKITRFMISKGADIAVVACNTATAAAISYLRSRFDIPFVGMEPAVKPAVGLSKSGVVGVLATSNTFKGKLYQDTVLRCASGVKLVEIVGKGLVEAVEKGNVPEDLIKQYVGEMVGSGADTIVLGCTHFPFLEKAISECAGPSVNIVNPAPAVARQTMKVLGITEGEEFRNPGRRPVRMFCSTGDTAVLQRMAMSIEPSLLPCDFIHIDC